MTEKSDLELVIGGAAAALLVTSVLSLRGTGMTYVKSVSFATMALLEDEFGRGIWRLLGFPKSTGEEWRREMRAAGDLVAERPSEEVLAQVHALMSARAERLMKK